MKKVILILLIIFISSVCYSQTTESAREELIQAYAVMSDLYAEKCNLYLEFISLSYKESKLINNVTNFQIIYDSIMESILEYWNHSVSTSSYLDTTITMSLLMIELENKDVFNKIDLFMSLLTADIKALNKNNYKYTLEAYSILSQYQELLTNFNSSFQSFRHYRQEYNSNFVKCISLAKLEW